MTRTLSLGFSSCPNDTFAFHALVHGITPAAGIGWRVEMQDIEALNRRALGVGPLLDVTKLSLPAFARVRDEYRMLDAGAAIGRGCGPLVVHAPGWGSGEMAIGDLAGRRLAIPGELTTANFLRQVFLPRDVEPVFLRFDAIPGAVARSEVAAGVIIHESRFTYAGLGLRCLVDLGAAWEESTGLPLPLAVIAARRGLPEADVRTIEAALARSVEYAGTHPEDSRAYVREHAQETGESVCREHIALYVNDFSVRMGAEGRHAVEHFLGLYDRLAAG